ncbi:MAG: DNA mismatch repair endonuclease MutL, partial [Treponema sp.]|nr:DNA mismatch repair endonuclease MutL [Treponema sp.]
MFSKEQPILVLPPEEARRIAAGEVIDKPAAQVREFLDNAIDSGGSFIELLIEDGGIRLTEVVDNGCGMDKEDLALCWYTHATSKIRCLDDLKTSRTLGFRGEALAAAVAVARLEILSSRDGRGAWKLSVGPGEKTAPLLEAAQRTAGTSVRSLGLYDTIPARKRFLKRPGSEAAACRQIFNEKALAFPEIGFRFTQDGVLKSFLPAVPSYKERFRQIFLQENEGGFLHEIAAGGAGFSVSIVAGGQELFRSDRRLQFVFANDRRIQDFSLLQALEYGLQGWFPNGTHPMGAVFVSIDPALADFNIHPAKREARFLDPGAIHHAVTSALRDFCRAKLLHDTSRNAAVSVATSGTTENLGSRASYLAMEALLANTPDFAPLPGRSANCSAEFAPVPGRDANFSADFATLPNAAGLGAEFAAEASAPYQTEGAARYLGRLFGVFILVEKGERLFIIDQHA